MPFVLLLVTLAFSAGPAAGQRKQAGTMLSLDVDWLGGALSYARSRGPESYWGAEAGIGGGFLNRMLLSGRHFSDEDGPSYEPRDGFEDKELIEILHVAAFRRTARSERVSWDVGLRTSVFVHFDSSDDDPGLPLFAGGYANIMFGNRWLKAGPRLLVGVFTEGRGSHEFGVYLVPFSGRVSFGW